MAFSLLRRLGKKALGSRASVGTAKKKTPSKKADNTPVSKSGAPQKRKPSNRKSPNRRPTDKKQSLKRDRSQKPWSIDEFPVPPEDGKMRFHDLDLPDEIMHGIADLDFRYCTPVQARVLSEAREGRNVAGRAQTGTGKTAAFLVLCLARFANRPIKGKRRPGTPRALVIAPTRELVVQIAADAKALGKYCDFRCVAVYGGMDYSRQERDLDDTVDLIAATPGRLLDFKRKGILDLNQVEILIIDEADRMLDMGFIPDVKAIIRSTPPKERRRTMLFSATLNDDVMRLSSQWMPDPVVVEIEPEQVAVDTVRQLIYSVKSNDKFKVLYNLLKRDNIGRVLIFSNRRYTTEKIADELHRYGVECEMLSGAVAQKKRMRVLDDFKQGRLNIVVATDVAGRGLHVDDIDHVINYDLPYEPDDYVHRIGRTGRAGAKGTAVSFACEDESFVIPEIEEYIGEELSCQQPEACLLENLPKPLHSRRPSSQNRSGSGEYRSGPSGRSSSRRPSGNRSQRTGRPRR